MRCSVGRPPAPRGLRAEERVHASPSKLGRFAAPVMGMAFAFGWTPCIGPILGGVLTLASNEASVTKGAALLLIYSAGLGVPFVLAGLGMARLQGAFGWVRRHYRAINVVSGVILMIFGFLLFTNKLAAYGGDLPNFFRSHGLRCLIR